MSQFHALISELKAGLERLARLASTMPAQDAVPLRSLWALVMHKAESGDRLPDLARKSGLDSSSIWRLVNESRDGLTSTLVAFCGAVGARVCIEWRDGTRTYVTPN